MNTKLYLIRSNKTKFGGAENYLKRLSKGLVLKNIDHKVVNSIFPKFLPSWLKVLLFNFQVSLTKGARFYFSLDRITCPDIYRAGDGVHKVFLGIESKSKLNPLHYIYLFLEKRCFEKAIKIIAISNMVKKNIISTYKIDEKKIHVVYPGIELKKLNKKISFDKLAYEYSLKQDFHIIIFVGSGFKRKGVMEFLQIISKLDNLENIRAFVIGKDKNLKFYQKLAKELCVENKVIFTGPREDVDDFYSISDIFLFPTHYEPFGNVVLEAMNFSNVVFTTNQCGASELLDDNHIMKNPSDNSVVIKINNLLKNQNELEMIQDNNRDKSIQFSIENNVTQTLNIIDEVIN